jgi:membrane protein
MSDLFSTTRHTIRSAASGFSKNELMTRAAALAFYSALSLAPLLVLLIWVLSLHSGWERQLLGTLRGMAGPRAADAVNTVVESAKARPHTGKLAGLIGVLVTLVGASAIFVQLQTALNRIWNVRPKPGAAVGTWLRARAHALTLLVGILFLLIISFALSALIQLLVPGDTLAWQIVENLISAVVFVGVFGAMYKVLPDVIIGWSEALSGASLTAVLFIIGKFLIGLYMQHSNVGGAYGPAGAIIVLLTWIYYSAIIVLLGAELTHGLAAARGAPIRPSAHAVEMEAALTEKAPT